MLLDKNLFGIISILLNIVGTAPYCVSILRGNIKPHLFTWVVWTLTMGIAAAARDAGDAGPGAWGTWAGAASCFIITVLAFFQGEKNIKRSDVLVFVAALMIIPVWRMTESPLLAVILVTIIDVLGYYPTFRKSYINPHEEMMYNYMIANAVHIMSLLANTINSWTTVLMPAVLLVVNTILITVIFWRRYRLRA